MTVPVLEVALAALVLLAWWGFLRLLRKGRATTRREIIVEFTVNVKPMMEALARAEASMLRWSEAMRRFNQAWADAEDARDA